MPEASSSSSSSTSASSRSDVRTQLAQVVGSQQQVISTLEEKQMILLKRLLEYEDTFRHPPTEASDRSERMMMDVPDGDLEELMQSCLESITGSGELHNLLEGRQLTSRQASQIAMKLIEHYTRTIDEDKQLPLLALLAQHTIAQHILSPASSPHRAAQRSPTSSASSLVAFDVVPQTSSRSCLPESANASTTSRRAGVRNTTPTTPSSAAAPAPPAAAPVPRAPRPQRKSVWEEDDEFSWLEDPLPDSEHSTVQRLRRVDARSRELLAYHVARESQIVR